MIKLYRKLEELSLSNNFVWAADHVRDWNLTAAQAKGGKFTPLDLQLSFVEEEFNEVLEAIDEGNIDHLMKEACDLFVVTSYAGYLLRETLVWRDLFERDTESKFEIGTFMHLLSRAMVGDHQSMNVAKLCRMSTALLFQLRGDTEGMMKKVLESNDSKFATLQKLRAAHGVPAVQVDIPSLIGLELKELTNRFEGRYTGFTCSEVVYKGEKRFVFLDGKGKIMKPSSFVDVDEL
mgnify:FL=1